MESRMNWDKLISLDRFGSKKKLGESRKKIDARNEFERDIDRIIFSSEFRRLQDKTQVFPIPKSDFVHTRLTHSLEVAAVGRSLGKLSGKFILEKEGELKDHKSGYKFRAGHFGNIVAAACLAHDIGNPPIGHSGEDSFRRFFAKNEVEITKNFKLESNEISDFKTFEGNASGFRILSNDHPSGQPGGLKLTYTTLAAFSKYPKKSGSVETNSLANKVESRVALKNNKFGFFQREKDVFKNVALHCGLLPLSVKDEAWCRHPLAFLVEAADTICYSCIDIEDGYHLGFVSYDDLFKIMKPLAQNVLEDDPCDFDSDLENIESEREKVGYLRSRAINNLTLLCIQVFSKNYEAIMTGLFDAELTDSMPKLLDDFERLKSFNSKMLYNTPKGVQIEIAGYRILEGLLEYFLDAIEKLNSEVEYEKRRSKKILGLLPDQFKPNDKESGYLQILKICDFISRSTDSYAIDIYKKLNGERFPFIE